MSDYGYVTVTPAVNDPGGVGNIPFAYNGNIYETPVTLPGTSSGGSSIAPGGFNLANMLGNIGRVLTGQPVVSSGVLPAGSTGTLAPTTAASNLPALIIIGVVIMLMFSKGSK